MSASETDLGLLWDMLEAARAVERFISGRKLEQYLSDELLQAAIERKIEIIGEAARKVSAEFQQAHPDISWSKIVAQRHILAHDYGRIEHDRVWSVITVHIPELVSQLASLVPAENTRDRE